MALSGAQAADLPVKAKAVEYVRVCSLYGAGFFYIPGTDTCIKLGGYLRADVTFNGGAHGAPAWSGDLGQQNRYADYFVARSRMALTVDTRTATEYGVVRTFGQGDFQFNNFGGGNPAIRRQLDRSASTQPAVHRGRRLRRGRVSLHPVRRLHLRQVVFRLLDALERFPGQHQFEPARRQQYRYRRQQHPVHRGVRQRRIRHRSVSTIPRSGIAPPSTI